MITICILNIVILTTIEQTFDQVELYSLYYILAGATLGGCMVIFINFAILVFGPEIGEQMPGYIWTCYSTASIIQYIAVNLYDVASQGYQPILYCFAAFNVASMVIVVTTTFQGEWENHLTYL